MIPGRKIGIVWQGSQEHKTDRARSVSLTRFAALASVPEVSLCSIQKGFGSEQITDGSADGLPVRDFGSLTRPSFADTAALIQVLDLVVTIDTAVAHVASAVGAPVWVLIGTS
jgi:ADP-heptose:LPS heptosyltransferase